MTVPAEQFKNVMARVASTVTIVTAHGEEDLVGLTATAFMSVSADPAIVLVCIDKSTASLQPMLDADGFTVNLMPEGSEDLAMLFAKHGADKFGGSEWSEPETPDAGPILSDAYARLECTTIDRTEMAVTAREVIKVAQKTMKLIRTGRLWTGLTVWVVGTGPGVGSWVPSCPAGMRRGLSVRGWVRDCPIGGFTPVLDGRTPGEPQFYPDSAFLHLGPTDWNRVLHPIASGSAPPPSASHVRC